MTESNNGVWRYAFEYKPRFGLFVHCSAEFGGAITKYLVIIKTNTSTITGGIASRQDAQTLLVRSRLLFNRMLKQELKRLWPYQLERFTEVEEYVNERS